MDRFWSKVDKNGPVVREELGQCWLWTGKVNDQGYGQFYIGVKKSRPRAHRVSFAIATGRDVVSLGYICHRCDNPPCVNPGHLYEGTARSNTADMTARGRHGRAKMTESQVVEARTRAASGENMHDIIRDLDLDYLEVRNAAAGKTWSHLTDPPPVNDLVWSKHPEGRLLSQDQVIEILTALEHRYHGQQKYLAEKYGVTRTVIRQIGLGNIYKHARAMYHNRKFVHN